MKIECRQALMNLVTRAYANPSSIESLSLGAATALLDALEETGQEELKKCKGTPCYTPGETE